MAGFLKQLPQFIDEKSFSGLTNDVFLIGKEDLRCLGLVDILIAGEPCQGSSHARGG